MLYQCLCCDFAQHLINIIFLSPGLQKFFLDAADDGDGDAAEGDGEQDADAPAGER